MKALAQLGLKVNGEIPLDILLSENFNGSLYGMTQEESAKVRALRQVVTQYNKAHSSDKSQPVTDSQKAADLVYGMLRDLAHEEVCVAYMTACNTVISVEMVFKGSVDNVLISPRVILAKALSLDASNIILYHNHPSGSVMPSTSCWMICMRPWRIPAEWAWQLLRLVSCAVLFWWTTVRRFWS